MIPVEPPAVLGTEEVDVADSRVSPQRLPMRWMMRFLRPRLSLASLLWITFVCALLFLWYQDHKRLTEKLNIVYGTTSPSWSIDQIRGAPDTPQFGDIGTAWASKLPDDREEWVLVEFADAVQGKAVHVFETFNPGAVVRVYSVDTLGSEQLLWSGTDPLAGTPGGGVSIISFPTTKLTRRLRIVIDSAAFPGWNEIDAVRLMDDRGRGQWVNRAWASSSFGRNREMPSWFWP